MNIQSLTSLKKICDFCSTVWPMAHAIPPFLYDSQTAMDGLFVVPHGIQKIVEYVKEFYDNPIIIITENGKKFM